jgi:isopenicillin N synthase-like dioxygenase
MAGRVDSDAPPLMEYFDAVATLGYKLAQIFALSLNLVETYFDKYITLPAAIARVLCYLLRPAMPT